MNVIDLFCGCGGLSKGFIEAGYKVLIGIDNDQSALNTFVKNHNGAIAINADLSKKETFCEIEKNVNNRNIDVIIAGPPCQGFSLTGPRNFDDERNKLYLAVIEMVKYYKPSGFIIENVPGMATLYNGQIKNEILRRFESIGYNVACNIICAADYGVPQIRKRLIFMGIKKELGTPKFPKPTFSPENYRTCRDAISDLPSRVDCLGEEVDSYICEPRTEYQRIMRKQCSVLYNHVATKHKQFVKDTIALVPEGGNYKDLPSGWGESRKFNEAWTRYDGNKPSKTIDTGHRNHFHYEFNRVPTVRENARLQSFPDDFIFTGTRTQQYRQVGNAVPPLLGYALAKALKKIIENDRNTKSEKIKLIDLFAGCGGLMDGFEQTKHFKTVAAVEWEEAPCNNFRQRLKNTWHYTDADDIVLRFDIQRTDELFRGWTDDKKYGTSIGLDALVQQANGIDIIIGGPPCQAYSIAGRIRDEKGMKDDYRNYLFESYVEVVKRYKPKLFIFENVPGMLSAKPGGSSIAGRIRDSFNRAGYVILSDLSKAVIDLSEYGVPQRRKRIIIIGINSEYFGKEQSFEMIQHFYSDILPKYKVSVKKTVRQAIGDLPKLYPLREEIKYNGRVLTHSLPIPFVANHIARWQSKRDMEIFSLLAEDIESGRNEYVSTESLKKLYTEKTGKHSKIHKYYVLRWDEQSNLIPAHLFKDGLRHIHPDAKQSRSITVREAARLQTFDDDYIFLGNNMENYKMIGNAVPPRFANALAQSVYDLLDKYKCEATNLSMKTFFNVGINHCLSVSERDNSMKTYCKGDHNGMKYYLKKCGHQELGSVDINGRPQRGRYLLTSMNKDVLDMFPPLSESQLNDSALLPIIPLYSGKKVYCNYVYHNDKFHGSTAKHPRNEYRIYLNKALEDNKLLFDVGDIIIIRPQVVTNNENESESETVYYLYHIKRSNSEIYKYFNDIIMQYPINGGYALYYDVIPEFEDLVAKISYPNNYKVEVDNTVTNRVVRNNNAIAELFNASSFRDFVMVGYENLCAITNSVIKYESYMNLEAAHIRPKSHGGLLLPSNGIALCRDLHWAFDKGFFTIDDDYKIVVHSKASSEFLQQFNNKQIRLPKNDFFVPDLENIKYHRNNVFGLFLKTGRL